jgi:hypothetical protein
MSPKSDIDGIELPLTHDIEFEYAVLAIVFAATVAVR